MGGDLKIDWREPDAVRKARRSAMTAVMMGPSVRLSVGVGVLLVAAWLVQHLWFSDLEVLWAPIAISLGVLAVFPVLTAVAYGMVRHRYRLTDEVVGNRDNKQGMCAWTQAVCFSVRPVGDVPGVDEVRVYAEYRFGRMTPFWRWVSGVEEVEPEWRVIELVLPKDPELARRVVVELERRMPRLSELAPERRSSIEAKLESKSEATKRVVTGLLDAIVVLLGGALLGMPVGVLLFADVLPDVGNNMLWILLALSPILVVGPGTWLALKHHGRAGLARFRIRMAVFGANGIALMVAFFAVIGAAVSLAILVG